MRVTKNVASIALETKRALSDFYFETSFSTESFDYDTFTKAINSWLYIFFSFRFVFYVLT